MLPEVFVGAFQNGLKTGNFKESLVQKSIASMEEIAARAKMQNVTSREKKATLKKEFGIQERERKVAENLRRQANEEIKTQYKFGKRSCSSPPECLWNISPPEHENEKREDPPGHLSHQGSS